MKRLHVHVSVKDVPTSIRFYRDLFNAEPVVTKPDYAKWMLDDPRVNFAISQRDRPTGVDHLGIQVEDRTELAEVYERLKRTEGLLSKKGRRPVATRKARSHGFTTRKGSSGRPS